MSSSYFFYINRYQLLIEVQHQIVCLLVSRIEHPLNGLNLTVV